MPVILPDDASPGETGHVNDHNVIRDAVAELQSQITSALVEADIVAGTNVTITPGAGNSITISASGTGTSYDDTAVVADIAALEAADVTIQADLDLAETNISSHEQRLTLLESYEQGGGYSVSNWYEVHLESFLTADAAYYSIATRKEGSNVVRLRGRAAATTWASGDTLFTIVRDHRPTKPVSILAMVTDTIDPVRLLIGIDGTVKAQSAMSSPVFLCVDGLEFSATEDVVIPDSVTPPPVTGTTEIIWVDDDNSGATTTNTQDFILPSGLLTGDYGIIVVTFNQSTTPANPTQGGGWALIDSNVASSSYTTRVWGKALTSADSGATVSWNAIGSCRFVGQLVVIRNSLGKDVSATWNNITSGTSVTVPSITATESDTLLVAFPGSRLSAGAGSGWTTNVPSGWTEYAGSDVFSPATDTASFQQAIITKDVSPTINVATGTFSLSTSITTAARSVYAVALRAGDGGGGPEPTWTMYWGSSAEGGVPDAFEDGTGIFTGKGLGGLTLPLFRSYENINNRNEATVALRATAERAAVDSRLDADHTAGRLPLISFKVPSTDWAGVANGSYDADWLDPLLGVLAGRAYPVYVAFHHEPRGDGTPANWVAMQKYIRTKINALENGSNVSLVGILNGYSFDVNEQDLYYHAPGTGVHFMGLDSYNPWLNGTGTWITVENCFSPLVTLKDWGYEHGIIGEWGVDHYTPNSALSTQWVLDAYQYCYEQEAEAVSYFNSQDHIMDDGRLTSFITTLGYSTVRRITD